MKYASTTKEKQRNGSFYDMLIRSSFLKHIQSSSLDNQTIIGEYSSDDIDTVNSRINLFSFSVFFSFTLLLFQKLVSRIVFYFLKTIFHNIRER